MAAAPKRIDTHFHVLPEFYMDAVTDAGITRSRGKAYPDWSEDLSLKLMDENGIATVITSFSTPHVHFGDGAKARELARRCNDFQIGLQTKRPDRFGTFAVLPLPDVDSACREAIHALDDMKADGVTVMASYGETFFGDSMFDPLFAELDRRKAIVFVHPTQHPESKKLPLDLPLFVAEYPMNTARAALNLMTKGVLRRYPNIRFLLAHAGGVLPMLAWRLAIPRVPPVWQEDVSEMLRKFWYEIALAAGKQALGSLVHVAAADKIMFGTDWPYTSNTTVEWTIRDYADPVIFTDAQRANVDRANALKLFPRLAQYGA